MNYAFDLNTQVFNITSFEKYFANNKMDLRNWLRDYFAVGQVLPFSMPMNYGIAELFYDLLPLVAKHPAPTRQQLENALASELEVALHAVDVIHLAKIAGVIQHVDFRGLSGELARVVEGVIDEIAKFANETADGTLIGILRPLDRVIAAVSGLGL